MALSLLAESMQCHTRKDVLCHKCKSGHIYIAVLPVQQYIWTQSSEVRPYSKCSKSLKPLDDPRCILFLLQ